MKKNLLLFFVFSGLMILSVSAQKTSKKSEKDADIPKDFPTYPTSGDELTNEKNYLVAVKEWIRNHPDEYLDYMNKGVDILQFRGEYNSHHSNQTNVQNSTNDPIKTTSITNEKVIITQQEFDALPQHKKDYYKTNPGLIEIK